MEAKLIQRFWDRVLRGDPTVCWPWQGYRDPDGYGRIGYGYRQYRAHRLAYELTYGPLTVGQMVCHRCDNPPCCNPAHLFAGTQVENMRDRAAKGRYFNAPARRYLDATLSAQDAAAIRGIWAQPDHPPLYVLASRYNVTRATIGTLLGLVASEAAP